MVTRLHLYGKWIKVDKSKNVVNLRHIIHYFILFFKYSKKIYKKQQKFIFVLTFHHINNTIIVRGYASKYLFYFSKESKQ